ncbi:MAG TPA: tyrosine-type recombinase/integrase [Bryobacteraceae bacterium]|nr:tyrosine-type recombinase/integrase [Bryobacteraceae bacterium]
MLTIYRRHVKSCEHKQAGRKYRRCRCPIWADGFLGNVEIRESLELRDWEKAQQKIREWEAEGMPTVDAQELSIEHACEAFEKDAVARGLREATLKKYRVLFKQLHSFARAHRLSHVKQFDLLTLRKFRESWIDGGISAVKKLERLRALFRFAHESGWIDANPTRHIKNPKITNSPTMPYNHEEMIAILAASTKGKMSGEHARRLRAFVLLLRYSGMRIGDTATCPAGRLTGDRLFLYTQKTGVPVNVKLPPFVVDELNTVPAVSREYFFWTGEGKKDTVSGNWRRSLRKVFELAGINGGHPHRFRDTFAIELLLAGVPLERVSVLLGHSSIRVTEKHYSPWVRARQEQLEADLERSWQADPVVLAATKGTPEVHRKQEAVN